MSSKALTPDERESQIINQAVDLAEKQIQEGTASSAVIVHFLKLATAREKSKKAKLDADTSLAYSKVELINRQADATVTAEAAIEAMTRYAGRDDTK